MTLFSKGFGVQKTNDNREEPLVSAFRSIERDGWTAALSESSFTGLDTGIWGKITVKITVKVNASAA